MRYLLPWFVTRAGCSPAPGKVGCEKTAPNAPSIDYQLSSQRADFFEEEVGLETTLKRPIVNTHDQPDADPQLYRRLHVIAGDANLCGGSGLLEGRHDGGRARHDRGRLPRRRRRVTPRVVPRRSRPRPFLLCRVTRPVPAGRPLEMADGGSRVTAVELPWVPLRLARKYADERNGTGLAACGRRDRRPAGPRPLGVGPEQALQHDAEVLDGQLDWVAKHQLLRPTWSATAAAGTTRGHYLVLQYHDLRPDVPLPAAGPPGLVTAAEADESVTEPPRQHTCLVPGHMPGPLARGGGRHELGQPRP